MTYAGELFTDLNNTVEVYGQKIRFRYFTGSQATSGYDDDVVLTKSGTDTWVSGLVQPLGKSEARLLQQGKLTTGDLKVYVDGGIDTSGTWRIGIGGSPPAIEYALTEENLRDSPMINGSVIYQKMFIRQLPIGSLVGE